MTSKFTLSGSNAAEIARAIEEAITTGALAPGERLPTVRALALSLRLSPATVNAAFRMLRERGLISASKRAGTRVVERTLPPSRRLAAQTPRGVRNLADGNPDPSFLPPLRPALARLSGRHWLYGESGQLPALVKWARKDLTRDGLVADKLAIVGGSLDGVERALQAHLRYSDSVAVEDPGYGGVLDLLPILGLRAIPVSLDAEGMRPDSLARAIEQGAKACIITPRAQNPTGAALTDHRANQLAEILTRRPDILVIEDDHAGPISSAASVTVAGRGGLPRFVIIRSFTKTLGPDVRLAVLTGDAQTVARLERRQQAGAGWISHVMQELAVTILADPATPELIGAARDAYRERRRWLTEALTRRGIAVTGRSGFNVWIPVADEAAVTAALQVKGWAVRPGQSFRLSSAPGIRVTISTLQRDEAESFVDALESSLRGAERATTA